MEATVNQSSRAALVVALPETLHPEQRLDAPQTFALVGIKRSKVYALIARGEFPAPERRGTRCSRWRAGDLLNWLDEQRRVSGAE
jgi:prophage regulatory protein